MYFQRIQNNFFFNNESFQFNISFVLLKAFFFILLFASANVQSLATLNENLFLKNL